MYVTTPAQCQTNGGLNQRRAAYENIEITTRSHPDAFPSALRQKRKTQTKTHEGSDAQLKVA